jgi:hypothetical protein
MSSSATVSSKRFDTPSTRMGSAPANGIAICSLILVRGGRPSHRVTLDLHADR